MSDAEIDVVRLGLTHRATCAVRKARAGGCDCDYLMRAAALDSLRARLAAAERVVEAARGVTKGITAEPGVWECVNASAMAALRDGVAALNQETE